MTTTLTAESVVDLTPSEAYGLFGSSTGAGWLFGARCRSLTVGSAVSLRLPLDDRAERFGVELLGRLSAVRPGSSIGIEHAQPWRGRLDSASMRPVPDAPGCGCAPTSRPPGSTGWCGAPVCCSRCPSRPRASCASAS